MLTACIPTILFNPVVSMAEIKTLTPAEAGEFLQKKRLSMGLTAEKVLENTTIPNAPYLSSIERGKVNPGRSKHFPSLARFLRLTQEEIQMINPDLLITVTTNAPDELEETTRERKPRERRDVPIPAGLQQLIDEYSHKWPELKDPDLQQGLAQMRRRGPGPETFEEWEEFFAATRKHFRRREPK